MEIPYEVTPRRDTGLFNAKLGIWLFLASEVMLFGGLFSAYVFLRVGVQEGVDTPWPWGINVHKDFVYLGFLNTLVLILSSVWVVFAWVALKERNWRKFQLYMYGVVACAMIFMVVKGIEYNSKLNHHHGIKLTDNSVMEGTIVHGTDKIDFTGTKFTFNLQGGLPGFIKDITKDDVGFSLEGEESVEFANAAEVKAWFLKSRSKVANELALERKRYRSELAVDRDSAKPVSVNTKATVIAKGPIQMKANPRKVVAHSATSLSYKDGTSVEGKLVRDAVEFVVHEVDMQLVLPQNQRTSIVWDVIGDEGAKKQFFDAQKLRYDELAEYYEKRGKTIPLSTMRGYILNLHPVHIGGHGDDHGDGDHKEHGKEKKDGDHHAGVSTHLSEAIPTADTESAGSEEGHEHGGHDEHTISVPRDKIKFMGNHGPRYGNYYAIYFTMTALHGLHVVGGALVLLFMVVFGKKLYLKNPEHLANRVEVGGLFWHFVDLVWIFLFPLMYLL